MNKALLGSETVLQQVEITKAVDCVVGQWHDWGECDNECGIGKQKRRRKIVQPAQNGGKGCPILHQKRVCIRNDCLQQSVEYQREEMKEIGRILPAEYGLFRDSKEYNPLKDIRKNLFERYDTDNTVPTRVAYCGKFVITSTRKSCNQTEEKWAQRLEKGAKVCVECQPMAMSRELGNRCLGHGVFNEITRWNAINVPDCRGEWIMTSKHESCTCNLHGDSDYILV
ncbi:hypothetical protein ScPMuIL_006868 [Solemya velum]